MARTVETLEWAHDQITYTDRPIEEIAAACGCKEYALERRLERKYGQRSRAIRGESRVGRPPGEKRERWSVRLTEGERAEVNAAVARERKAGAETDGEALARVVRRAETPVAAAKKTTKTTSKALSNRVR